MKLIVAMCQKTRGIGYKNNLPFRLIKDLERFKKLTIGSGNNAIIMGRKTWLSLPKRPLPNRTNIVISSNLNSSKSIIYKDPTLVLKDKHKYDDIWVIGGSDLYKFYLEKNLIKEIYLTEIISANKKMDFDTYFPTISNDFTLVNNENIIHYEGVCMGPWLYKYKYVYKKYIK